MGAPEFHHPRSTTELFFRERLEIRRISTSMNVPRAASRRRVLKAGSIEFADSAIDCTIRNISENGAALDVKSPLYIPDRVMLVMQTEQSKRACRVVWRKERRIGVTFE
jgi:hypothetical protein